MLIGVLCVIAACFCWGLIFVIPKFLGGFNPIEVALGRYLFFGLISLGILFLGKRYLIQRSYVKPWLKSIWFAFISTLVAYTFVVFSTRYANPAVAALIFGMSPITIALYGNLYRKEYSFKNFLIPFLFISIGLILVNLDAFNLAGVPLLPYSVGLICGFIGLGAWTWYTIANFHFLEKNKTLLPNDWVIMQGVSTFFLVAIGMGIFAFTTFDVSKYGAFTEELQMFLIGSFILGTLCSWIAFFLWNCGNLRLPIALAGQLTIFEMIFGLFFVYLAEKRLPLPLEGAGILLMIIGVLTAFKTLKKLSNPVS